MDYKGLLTEQEALGSKTTDLTDKLNNGWVFTNSLNHGLALITSGFKSFVLKNLVSITQV
jgi:hypothetical protein